MENIFINVSREALILTVLVSAPAVLAALVVGLLLSIFQALTQIQEQTLGMAAKMIAVFGVLYLMGYWMAGHVSRLAYVIFSEFPHWIR
ncbi:MAG: type III secretion system export apparatus subunit SctS [Acidobacteriota bacterium]